MFGISGEDTRTVIDDSFLGQLILAEVQLILQLDTNYEYKYEYNYVLTMNRVGGG